MDKLFSIFTQLKESHDSSRELEEAETEELNSTPAESQIAPDKLVPLGVLSQVNQNRAKINKTPENAKKEIGEVKEMHENSQTDLRESKQSEHQDSLSQSNPSEPSNNDLVELSSHSELIPVEQENLPILQDSKSCSNNTDEDLKDTENKMES